MEPVLMVDSLTKTFKNRKVLKEISFEVHKGEIMAILGPNGAGKSTTIRTIMGILHPDRGTVRFSGYDAIPKQKIGYLPEERGLYQNVRVLDILLYLANLKDYPLSLAKERARKYLKKFGLAEYEKAAVEELSKGMGQKVQFIASFLHEPDLLILDEPFSGLDPVSQELFKEEIRRLAARGTAILLSSHQMNLVEELCDRLFMIHRGQKVIYGNLDEVKETYANFKCTIRCKKGNELLRHLPGTERILEQEGRTVLYLSKHVAITPWIKQLPDELEIAEMSIDRVSLHEIFLDIAGEKQKEKEEIHA